MTKAMKTHVSKVGISQMCRPPLNQSESSPSYLSTPPRQGTSSAFIITGAAKPFLLVQGLSLAGHGIQAGEAPFLSAQRRCPLETPLAQLLAQLQRHMWSHILPAACEPALPSTVHYHH